VTASAAKKQEGKGVFARVFGKDETPELKAELDELRAERDRLR
jgi:hypothetical protein